MTPVTTTPTLEDGFVDLTVAGRALRIEHRWIDRARTERPLMVFLHEGLGSVSMWRDFPQRLCAALGLRGLVYSRPGYGRSTPRPPDERWGVDFMHRQAFEVLPALLSALDIDTERERPILFGHSDGGSIALLHAARWSERVRGVVAMAPHILVEGLSIRSIQQARTAYAETDLRTRLARHHDDPDSAFHGWNDIWLDPAFRHWTIEAAVSAITCPVLAIQGLNDEYGTLEQIHGIARRVPDTRVVEIPEAGHSPHRDQPAAVLQAVGEWLATLPQ